jgi:hypothetical protein
LKTVHSCGKTDYIFGKVIKKSKKGVLEVNGGVEMTNKREMNCSIVIVVLELLKTNATEGLRVQNASKSIKYNLRK